MIRFDSVNVPLTITGSVRMMGGPWERLTFEVRPGENITELAERLYLERRFDAWIDRLDAEIREARHG